MSSDKVCKTAASAVTAIRKGCACEQGFASQLFTIYMSIDMQFLS
ncbi:hypothetical protein [Rhodoluna limnophila]|nr:hypothetical protein [Rhodoluna limnophila]